MNSFSWNKGGIMGTFLLFEMVFNINWYGFEFLWTLSNLLISLEYYFCFESSITHVIEGFAETLVSQFSGD